MKSNSDEKASAIAKKRRRRLEDEPIWRAKRQAVIEEIVWLRNQVHAFKEELTTHSLVLKHHYVLDGIMDTEFKLGHLLARVMNPTTVEQLRACVDASCYDGMLIFHFFNHFVKRYTKERKKKDPQYQCEVDLALCSTAGLADHPEIKTEDELVEWLVEETREAMLEINAGDHRSKTEYYNQLVQVLREACSGDGRPNIRFTQADLLPWQNGL